MELKEALKIIKAIGETTSNAEITITFNDKMQVDSMNIPIDDADIEFLHSIIKIVYGSMLDFKFDNNSIQYTDFEQSDGNKETPNGGK